MSGAICVPDLAPLTGDLEMLVNPFPSGLALPRGRLDSPVESRRWVLRRGWSRAGFCQCGGRSGRRL